MILGRDLLNKLGLTLDFSTATFAWEEASVPMKSTTATAIESLHIKDPTSVNDMLGRITDYAYKKILGDKYYKADLHLLENSQHLEIAQWKNLLDLLKKYETLFDVLYDITLKEGAMTHHGLPHSIQCV